MPEPARGSRGAALGLWSTSASRLAPAASPRYILFVFFCGAHSQRVMSEVRNAGPPCVMRSDSHF